MNFKITSSIAICMALTGGLAMAQDQSKAATKMEAKKDMSMQDCKDHANTMKGQKRTDPATAETTAKCDAMMKGGGKMGSDAMKPGAGSGTGGSSATPMTGTGTTSGDSSGATGTGPAKPTK